LHIAFKTGLVGLVLLGGLVAALVIFWRKRSSVIESPLQPLAIAGIAGLLFMLPDMIIGTPIPQVRTMQMLAFCLALPYVAYGVTWNPERVSKPVLHYGQHTLPVAVRAS
jgi:hypothetical protein